jgi:hypothetical protein
MFDSVARFSQYLSATFDSTSEKYKDFAHIPSELNIYYLEWRTREALHQVAASDTLGQVIARER